MTEIFKLMNSYSRSFWNNLSDKVSNLPTKYWTTENSWNHFISISIANKSLEDEKFSRVYADSRCAKLAGGIFRLRFNFTSHQTQMTSARRVWLKSRMTASPTTRSSFIYKLICKHVILAVGQCYKWSPSLMQGDESREMEQAERPQIIFFEQSPAIKTVNFVLIVETEIAQTFFFKCRGERLLSMSTSRCTGDFKLIPSAALDWFLKINLARNASKCRWVRWKLSVESVSIDWRGDRLLSGSNPSILEGFIEAIVKLFFTDPWSMSGSHFGRQNTQGNHVEVPEWDWAWFEEEDTSRSWYQMFCHIRSGSAKWKRWRKS